MKSSFPPSHRCRLICIQSPRLRRLCAGPAVSVNASLSLRVLSLGIVDVQTRRSLSARSHPGILCAATCGLAASVRKSSPRSHVWRVRLRLHRDGAVYSTRVRGFSSATPGGSVGVRGVRRRQRRQALRTRGCP